MTLKLTLNGEQKTAQPPTPSCAIPPYSTPRRAVHMGDWWRGGTGGVGGLVAVVGPGSTTYRSLTPMQLCAVPPNSALLACTSAVFFPGVRTEDPAFGRMPTFPRGTPPACRFTFAEIFAGIGGFRLGLEALRGPHPTHI